MSITIDKEIAEDLINSKLNQIDQEIQEILKKWQVESVDELIVGCREGKFDECENDAIDLTNLKEHRNELFNILKEE